MSDKTFADKHILVTGGGTGIGRASALAFAGQGAARVTVVGRRSEPLVEIAAVHPAIVPLVADVTTAEGLDAITESVAGYAGIDVLIHNAGILATTPLVDLRAETVRSLLEINVVAPALLTGRLLPMLASPGGCIVLVSSISARVASPHSSVYSATKAAVDSFTRSWALELGHKGIRVNGVAPGAVDTEIFSVSGMSEEETKAFRDSYAAAVPAGRIGQGTDVACWITRLAEPASSWVTGEIITIDGGGLL